MNVIFMLSLLCYIFFIQVKCIHMRSFEIIQYDLIVFVMLMFTHFLILIWYMYLNVNGHLLFRYKTTVLSAREKVSIVRTETDMARFDWRLFTYKYRRVNQIWL